MMNLMLLKWGRELGIRISWNMLVSIPGVPDECYGEMADWLALVHHLEAPQGTTPIRFDRFSPYQQQQDRYGLKLSPYPQFAPPKSVITSSPASSLIRRRSASEAQCC